ncbi:MAG: AzlC family ABC transporter permease [Spirochaetales bacterium]
MIPLVLGAAPFGLIYGTLAVHNGLSIGQTMALSLIVFAGSAQFIALSLFALKSPWHVILLTTFIVNLRHLLYSATLAPSLRLYPKPIKLLVAFLLTDEAFAVSVGRFNANDTSDSALWFYFGAGILMYINWQLCSLVGALFGNSLPNASSWGLDFAMPVAFIGMLVPYLRSLPLATSATLAGGIALLTHPLPHKLGLVLSSMGGILLGFAVETYLRTATRRTR